MSDNVRRGAIAESKAELRALLKGYIVSKPTISYCRYDMVVDDGSKLLRVQVKYAGTKNQYSDGCVIADFRNVSNSGKSKYGYNRREVDAIVVYIPPIDEVCYFPISFIEDKSTLTIRYSKAKNNQSKNVIYAQDYIW